MATSNNATVVDRAAALSEAVAASPISQKPFSAPSAQSPSSRTGPRASTSARPSVTRRRSTAAVAAPNQSSADYRSSARTSLAAVPTTPSESRTAPSVQINDAPSSTVPPEASSTDAGQGHGAEGEEKVQVSNPRLEGMRYALSRFLELLDMQMTSETMQTSLPMISTPVRELARKQMVEQLREATQAELEVVIMETQLEQRLLDLQEMTRQAGDRAQLGLQIGDEDMKDVWRPDLEISTALHARSVPEQQARVTELETTLAQIRATNEELSATLRSTSAQADLLSDERAAALDTLDETVAGLHLTDEMEARLRDAIDGMRDELGPRR